MNNAARPKVLDQLHPRAIAIFKQMGFAVPEGYSDDGVPFFTGVPNDTWRALEANHPKLLAELLHILRTDFPTFCILCEKIFAKKVGRLIPFVFNRPQLIAWNTMAEQLAEGKTLFLVFLKSRQVGISTLVGAFQHWQVWRLSDIECSMVGHEKALVHSFIDRLRIFHDELPPIAGIARRLRSDSQKARVPKDELYYADMRSKITTVVAKNVESRGRSSTHVLLSELAFYDDPDSLLQSLLPQLPPVGSEARKQCSVIIETTPNGKNAFYDMWQQTKLYATEWVLIFLPWMVMEDEYSLEPPKGWRMDDDELALQKRLSHIRKQIDGKTVTRAQMYWRHHTLNSDYRGDIDRFDMEYPSDDETCFLIKSRSMFKSQMRYLQACVVENESRAPEMFKKRQMECTGKFVRGDLRFERFNNPFGPQKATLAQLRLEPEFKATPDGHLLVWSPPQVGHTYVIGMDCASGILERDNAVACVIDVNEGRQVAEYAHSIGPEDFSDFAVALGYWYNTAMLYPEINGVGTVCIKRLKQVWQYPMVGREEKWDEIGVKANKFGHYTNDMNKPIMISFLKYLVDEHYLSIASDALLSEMSTFIVSNSSGYESFEADGNSRDDRVMALALACYVIRQSPKLTALLPGKPHAAGIPQAAINDSPPPGWDRPELPDVVKSQMESTWSPPWNPVRSELEMVDL